MNKAKLLILSSFLLSLLCSCRDSKTDRRLAESIEQTWQQCETDLQKAAVRAEGLRDSVKGASKYVRQEYDLLCIRLRDKNGTLPSSPDSAVLVADYFSRHGSDTDRERACYYLGSAYRDLKDYPKAVRHFMEATDIASRAQEADTLVWQNALSQLSYLYMMLLNYEEELKTAQQAVELTRTSQNLPFYLAEVASAYRHLGDTLRCLQSLDEVYRIAQREHFPPRYGSVMAFMLKMYSDYHHNEMLDTLLRRLLLMPEEHRPQNYELCLARSYEHRASDADMASWKVQSLTDSAILHYLSYYNNERTLSGRYEASAGLQRCHLLQRDFRQAALWGCRLYDINDSIIAGRAFEETQRTRDAFIYYRNREREQAIEQRDKHLISVSIIVAFAALSIIMGGVAFYYYRKKRFMEEIVSRERQLQNAEEEIQERSSELMQRKQINRELTQIALMSDATGNAENVVDYFCRVASGKDKMREEEWRNLMSAIETLYPGFHEAVQGRLKGQLREPLLRTICLMKIGLKPAQIAHVMDAQKQTVWNRIKRARDTCGDLLDEVRIVE